MRIETVVETITPAIAREYLKANVNNPRGQKVRMARIEQIKFAVQTEIDLMDKGV